MLSPARPVRAARRARIGVHGHTGAVLAVAFAPDGRLLASGGQDDCVRLWRLPDGTAGPATLEESACLDGHSGGVASLAFSADGRTLATGDWGRALRLWDT